MKKEKIKKTDKEWQSTLTPEQYAICREKGTETPFQNRYCDEKKPGIYQCVCCGNDLFRSDEKFDSGTGWPSFWVPIQKDSVCTKKDQNLSGVRQEVLCQVCDAHLGHVFEDGPPPTNLRYCINSVSLKLKKNKS